MQGQQGAGRSTERGKEKDQQYASHAVAPPASDTGHVVGDPFHVAYGRAGNQGLDDTGDEADADGGMESGDGRADKGRQNGQRMAEGDQRTEGRQQSGGQDPGQRGA